MLLRLAWFALGRHAKRYINDAYAIHVEGLMLFHHNCAFAVDASTILPRTYTECAYNSRMIDFNPPNPLSPVRFDRPGDYLPRLAPHFWWRWREDTQMLLQTQWILPKRMRHTARIASQIIGTRVETKPSEDCALECVSVRVCVNRD